MRRTCMGGCWLAGRPVLDCAWPRTSAELGKTCDTAFHAANSSSQQGPARALGDPDNRPGSLPSRGRFTATATCAA